MSEHLPESARPAEQASDFRESRIQSLISLNLHTYWSIVIIVLAFGLWDVYADATQWRRALLVRAAGAGVCALTGLFQTLPGKARWLPLLAKVRLVVAAMTALIAASMLDRGYGYGVAGVIVIVLTGPYTALDARDLFTTNLSVLISVTGLMLFLDLAPFDMIGTVVFVLLGVAVSTLLGRVMEASNKRAFLLELEQHRDARTDALTGLANRRAMQERGRSEMKLARRTHAPLSVILGDLDHFKNINDKYGHEAGDVALTKTAQVLKASLRESDALGRWGGEEFMAVLPATGHAGAVEVAERMRLAIASCTFAGVTEGATISLGVATSEDVDDPGLEWDLLIKEADLRLYRAKHDGRNRVVSA